MTAWQTVMLKDVVSILGDGLHGTPEYDDNGDYYFINGNNLSNGKIVIKEGTRRASKVEFEKYRKNLNDRTILVSINGTIGNIAVYSNEPCILGKSACYFNVLQEVDRDFIYYVATSNHFQTYISEYANGTTINNVPLKAIREYSFILPNATEQKSIAAILGSLDDKIDLLHRQNKTLEATADILFRQWFLEDTQEGWSEKSLSGIANFLNGLACQKYPPTNELEKLPVLKIRELSSGISETSDWATSQVKPDYIVEAGDVIFAWSASLMVKVWDGERCVLNQHLFKVTSDEFPKWFYLMWCKHHLEEFIAVAASHATTMGHIKRGDLDAAMVLVPPPDVLEGMTKQMRPLLEKQIANAKQCKTLEKLRDTLLPKLMSGEVRVAY